MTKLTTTLEKFDSRLWGYHFPVSDDFAKPLINGNNRRILCEINGNHTIHCALMQSATGFFILINKELVRKLELNTGDKVQLKLEKDHSEFGHEVPDSFLALLEQDKDGREYFYRLTPGKQRSLIYLVGKVKNIDSQINKGLAILEHLKMSKGLLDFKALNQLIKAYNQQSRLG